MYDIVFKLIELFAFILPAIPSALYVRLSILTIYFVAHTMGANKAYKEWKNNVAR